MLSFLIVVPPVASLAFSSCDVKIGILIATKTPMIATFSCKKMVVDRMHDDLKTDTLAADR